MRSWPRILFVLIALAVFMQASAAMAEEPPAPAAGDTFMFFDRGFYAATAPVSLTSQPAYIQWSAFRANLYEHGPHKIIFSGGLSSGQAPLAFGDPAWAGYFQSSVTYRYSGLFGGIIRPVARFTLGANQGFHQAQSNFSGYRSDWNSYAFSEAGLEIVYKGYGVGMTAGYAWPIDFTQPEKELTGFQARPRFRNYPTGWDQLWKNIYFIKE